MPYYVSYRRERISLHATEAAARADMLRLADRLRRQGLQVRRLNRTIYQVRAGRGYAPESIVVGWDGAEGTEPRRPPSTPTPKRPAGPLTQLRLFNPSRDRRGRFVARRRPGRWGRG